jgi:hypothetical protein
MLASGNLALARRETETDALEVCGVSAFTVDRDA